MDSDVASNKTKRNFAKFLQDFTNTAYFFHSVNSLTLHCAHKQSFIAIIIGDNNIYYKSDIGNRSIKTILSDNDNR